jgi:glycogen synthase
VAGPAIGAKLKICLVSSEQSPWGGIGHSLRVLATLLATRHEVTLIETGGPPGEGTTPPPGVRVVSARPGPRLERISFSCDSHRRSAAVLEAIEATYDGAGPDYLEVTDYHANGLVPLQARRAGHPLLRDTLIAVRASSTAELIAVHDGTLHQPGIELVAALEREQLRLADRLLWRGGDTLDLYRRYYSDLELPEAVRVPPPLDRPQTPPVAAARGTDRPLEIIFVGRLQRFKGTLDLVEACLGLEAEDWRLTLIGSDTATAPVGQSVEMTAEAMCGGDPRIRFEGPLGHEELQRRWARHDLLVVPSTFEVWGNVAVEAMRAGLPVLATPVGGPAGIVEHGVSGWHTDGLGTAAIRRALSRLLADRDEVERVRASGAVYERFLGLTDPEAVLAGYERLAGAARPPSASPPKRSGAPLVTGVVPYHRSSEHVVDAVESLLGQSHENLEVLIVNDGSFEPQDEILDRFDADPRVEVVTQLNRGESAARNLGAALARGEHVAMLDADNVLEPDFVARALAMLRAEPELAYVTCWLRFVGPDGAELDGRGYAPLGNRVVADDSYRSNDSNNWDGDTIALLPRRIFAELGYRFDPLAGIQSDWELYRNLREDGRFGAVIPALLARYRVRPDSLARAHGEALYQRAWGEARSRRRMRAMRWTAEA